MPADRSDVPRRRLRLRLDLAADTFEDLYQALVSIADDLDRTGVEEREQTSGGYSSGHHLTLTCNPDQTGEQYREQLAAWSRSRKENRDG